MTATTSIEWTEASWNPVRGCSIVSPGCTNCYAMKMAHRFSGKGKAYEGLTKLTKGGPVWTGKVSLHPELLDWPLRKRKPSRIFVNSMSDLFHEDVPDEFIDQAFAVMGMTPRHTFQVLTKRADRMLAYMRLPRRLAYIYTHWPTFTGEPQEVQAWPLSNVWLGVSVEDQARADERIPLLLQTPAAVRWISAEPLLGPVDLTRLVGGQLDALAGDRKTSAGEIFAGGHGVDWVVVGGESGPGARPMQLDWVRSLRDQCHAAGTPFFLKQLGRWPIATKDEGYPWAQLHDAAGAPIGEWGLDGKSRKGGDPSEWPQDLRIREYPA